MHLRTWFILGCGYTGTALAKRVIFDGERAIITRRDAKVAGTIGTGLGAEFRAVDLAHTCAPAPDGSIVVCCAPPGADPAAEIANLSALAMGASKVVYVSSTGVYAPGGGAWVDESWPLAPTTSTGRARLLAERALPTNAIALRAAGIYGPGRGLVDRLRARTYRIVGDGSAHVSRIHVDDLVTIILAAAGSTATGAFNCADDDPAAIGELADSLAATLGVPPPPRVPIESVTAEVAGMLGADRRISNARMKRELGVTLTHPSVRGGVA